MSSGPLPYTLPLPWDGVVAIAPICTPDQLPEIDENRALKRQCEGYSWRALARELLGDPTAQFAYNELGAPYIIDSKIHISVSHSSKFVAVALCPHPCGIDIESIGRNFEAVASRYISEEEMELGDRTTLLPQLWSIKEALYKLAARPALSLLDDLKVLAIKGQQVEAVIVDQSVKGFVTEYLGHVIAVCTQLKK